MRGVSTGHLVFANRTRQGGKSTGIARGSACEGMQEVARASADGKRGSVAHSMRGSHRARKNPPGSLQAGFMFSAVSPRPPRYHTDSPCELATTDSPLALSAVIRGRCLVNCLECRSGGRRGNYTDGVVIVNGHRRRAQQKTACRVCRRLEGKRMRGDRRANQSAAAPTRAR